MEHTSDQKLSQSWVFTAGTMASGLICFSYELISSTIDQSKHYELAKTVRQQTAWQAWLCMVQATQAIPYGEARLDATR